MIKYETTSADLLFVGVGNGASKWRIDEQMNNLVSGDYDRYIPIHPGYSLLSAGTADGITESEAGKVVEGYVETEYGSHGPDTWHIYEDFDGEQYETAKDALISSIRSLNLNPSETVVLFKIKN